MNAHVILAIFKRNFISYFSNPTGYVFICVFVLLSSFAAFWPNEFFNANLANLDQLNKYLPYIMLIFVPAITMSIWADERRQGTDELLLTIPAADFDVVIGKYLAAVAIFGVSLLFSMVSNTLVLLSLGSPDFGLLLGTYFGYFIVGLAMLAIGMVASFLTPNLTVGFALGVLFNAPLVFAQSAPDWLGFLRRLSIAEQFGDFSRGVISFASVGYFLAIVALMLYLSMVLIGRRHWRGGEGTQAMVGHYSVRLLALAVAVVCLSIFLSRHDRLRFDVTSERLNTLAPKSHELIASLDTERPVTIEYFISPTVPESYVQTRLNVLSTLRELQALNPEKIRVIGHDVALFSDAAARAEQQFDIRPVTVASRSHGARTQEEVFMGLAFTCGLDKVVIPFVDRGIPVEYEMVRSIATVSQQERKKIGVLNTDAKLYGSFDMTTFQPQQNQLIVEELKKQYDVVQVDPNSPITEKFDVLLAVQPSSLSPEQMDNFIAAVKSGQPTAIFEDPFPYMALDVPGTLAPKQPPGANNPFQMQQMPPEPKGDISQLWRLLGVDFGGESVVWQDYNPHPKLADLVPREWVFIDAGSGANQPFNEASNISSRLQQLLFLFPGSVSGLNASQLKFTPLVSTNDRTGTVPYDQIVERNFMGQPQMNPNLPLIERPTRNKYVLAAHISGKKESENKLMSDQEPEPAKAESDDASDDAAAVTETAVSDDSDLARDESAGDPAETPSAPEINVVLVSDIDCIYSWAFALRARGDDPDAEFDLDFDNVPFVLNVLDVLAGDDRFIEIRTRRPDHRTLSRVELATQDFRDKADGAMKEFKDKFENERKKKQKEFDDLIAKVKSQASANPQQAMMELLTVQEAAERELNATVAGLTRKRDQQIKQAEANLAREIRHKQDEYKRWAVLLPPIAPLVVGFLVFFNRRAKEREGVSRARLR